MSTRRALIVLGCAALALLPACDDNNNGSVSVSCSANPSSGRVPLAVQFSANATGGNGNYSVSWSFGDGTGSAELQSSRTFVTPGTYAAQVVVRSGNQQATCSQTVTAQPQAAPTLPPNTPPVAKFKTNPSPPSGSAPLTVDFNACQSTDADKDAMIFTFDVGDGPYEDAHCRKEHTYRAAGTYQAKICVNDGYPGHADQCQAYAVTVK